MTFSKTDEKTNFRFFSLFLLFNLVIATAIPSVMYRVLPLDTAEALVWGQEFTLGNFKHPPLSGWLAHLFNVTFGYTDFSMYFLSQVCVLVSYIFIYRTAREFYNRDFSIISSALLAMSMFHTFDSAKYNVNVLHLALWPVTAYFYIRSVKHNKLLDWILLGIVSGLCVLCKLSGGILLLMLFIYTLLDSTARNRLKSAGPYLAAVLALLVIAPYAVWLFQTDFLPLKYVGNRIDEYNGWWYPFALFFMLLFPALPSVGAFLVSGGWPSIKRCFTTKPVPVHADAMKYAGYLLFFPILFYTVLSFFVQNIDPMWCYPVYFPCGIFLLSFVKEEFITPKRTRWVLTIAVVTVLCFQTADVIYFLVHPRFTGHFPGKEFAQEADRFYREHNNGQPIPCLYGDMWHCALVQQYLPYHPMVCVGEDPIDNVRFRERISEKGGLLISSESDEEYKEFFKDSFDLPVKDMKAYTFHAKARLSEKTKGRVLIFRTILPAEKKK